MAPSTSTFDAPGGRSRRLGGRLWRGLVAVWAVITGLAPHVLHHAGPLAGAAIVSGVAGTALFAAVGFVATTPLLLRLRRRFGSWRAPAIALALFATIFTVTTILGPQLTGGATVADVPATTPADHDEHHP